MNFKRICCLALIFSFIYLPVCAQKMDDFFKRWKTVENLETKGLTASALAEVLAIFNLANASGNDEQLIKASMYQMKYRNMVEQDNKENNIFSIDSLIAKTTSPAKNILQSMQAELFWSYRQNNRYRFYDRTKLAEEKSNDITTWSIDKLNATIAALYKASLKNESKLKNTSLNGLETILQKGQNTRHLRPTLYDFLAHRALSYFVDSENDVTKPAYKFILNDERIFAPVSVFINTTFSTKDTSSLYFNALLLFQDILRFHINDKNPEALIDADLFRLSFANDHGVFTNKDNLYEQSLKNMESAHINFPVAAQAMFLRATIYYTRGQQYDRLTKKEFQYEIKRAKELCDSAITRFPKSEGAINAQNLIGQIKQPSLNLETEKVNIPGHPFRSLVKYKNINTLYFRIIKTNRDEIKKLNNSGYDKDWKAIVKLNPLRSWNVAVPDLQDYQLHALEIKIDELPAGIYFILSSIDPDFSLSKNIIAKQVTYISAISYITNNKDHIYVLNRDNGQPLGNAEVQLWQQTYNYSSRSYEDARKEKYVTDANGYAKLKISKDYGNNSIQVKFNKDELFLDDNYYNYNYSSYERPAIKKTFLFTDRSIYRPGQMVFFKGIAINTDSASKKSSAVNDYKTSAILYDANQQKLGRLQVQTNEYGSYNGSFKLPEGILNGQLYIMDSANQSVHYFSVEEYKRPKFFVDIKKPEGTFRLNDSVSIKGNAKAYAGNNIDGAQVIYRVVRKIRYPVWWGWGSYDKIWPPYGNQEAMEITNGKVTTNANGEFLILFKAIPDETVDKKAQPIFYYEISADITDINGETRSGNTSVAVAYQMLQVDIIAPEKIPADSLKNIRVKSTNLNDIYEKVTANLSIYKLQQPGRIFRERYWEMPDQFIISKTDYYTNFPYDAYSDELIMDKWPVGEKVIDITDTTSINSQWAIGNKQLIPGWYKIIVTTKDKYGEEVKAEKYILITDEREPATEEPVTVEVKNKNAQPGQKIEYSIQTAFDKIWLIHYLNKVDRSSNTSNQTIAKGRPFKNEIDVTENDRGGISLSYAFVKHNRVYSGHENFSIPWNNKDLNIAFETFRDKTLPGSEEKWKIKITGSKSEKVAAETLISMYDASLDQFKPHSWMSLKSLWPVLSDIITWTKNGFIAVNSEEYNRRIYVGIQQKLKSYDALINNGWNEGYGGRHTKFAMASRASGVVMQTEAAPMMDENEAVVVRGMDQKRESAQAGNSKKAKSEDKPESKSDSIIGSPGKLANNNETVQIRKNFNETAFFFPSLITDANGIIEFSFTIPEALTQWKLMTLAHSKDLSSGYAEKTVITQKPLMVQPNATRFLREGDRMEFSTKIVNLSDSAVSGTVQLELFDAVSNKAVDGLFKNVVPTQNFTTSAGKSAALKFPIAIPVNFNSALTWRIKAISKDGKFSDGEEAALPVLTNRMLVTETMPLNMRKQATKNFKFDKLLGSGVSGTLTHHSLTVEYSSNPSWYAVQALPYLMEYPYECAEQNFNRYYANILASFISNSTPKIKTIFEKWKTADTAALISNLQKNEELKSVMLQETPWVLDAQNESQQKKNIALLFDMVRMSKEKDLALTKLKEMQSSNGGFTWFKGGPDDRYMTQYIITGIGHLRKLNALSSDDYNKVKSIVDLAIPYLDARLKDEYDLLIKYKANLKNNNLSYTAIQYLYMRSFFKEFKINDKAETAYRYYREQSQKFWLGNSKYMQAMIALSLYRTGETKVPFAIIRSLKENAIYKEEMGMYWKDFTTGGYYWYQAPVESQAMMIEAFTDIDKDNAVIDDLKTWLLKQKQTHNWRTTKATSEACYALLLNGSNWLAEEKDVTINLANTTIKSSEDQTEAGTGYFKKRIEGEKIQSEMGNITVTVQPSQTSPTAISATSWGAVYWQYFEDLDNISSAETPLKLVKKLFIERNSDRGPVLHALNDGDKMNIGDKVKVRIELRVDRDMEYIHMKDMRAACMEPTNVISGFKWQGGLGYYETTKDASTNFFFGWLPRGTYVFEYPMFVSNSGNFSNGVTTIQCMYAPEFTSHSNGIRVNVE